jgi:calmodulin
MMARKMKESDVVAEYRDAFFVFDKDGDGFISAQELKEVMTNLGENATDQYIKKLMDAADLNRDGKIDFQEFMNMMQTK